MADPTAAAIHDLATIADLDLLPVDLIGVIYEAGVLAERARVAEAYGEIDDHWRRAGATAHTHTRAARVAAMEAAARAAGRDPHAYTGGPVPPW